MMKISHILTGALVAAGVMFADWAVAAPLSLSHTLSRGDQMAPVDEQTEQGYETPAQFRRQVVAYSWVMVAVSLLLWPVADTSLVYPVAAAVLGAVFLVEAHRMWSRAKRSDVMWWLDIEANRAPVLEEAPAW